MKAEKLRKISEEGEKKNLNYLCTSTDDVRKLLIIMAKMGFYDATVICDSNKFRSIESDLAEDGYRIYAYVNGENKGQLDITWS